MVVVGSSLSLSLSAAAADADADADAGGDADAGAPSGRGVLLFVDSDIIKSRCEKLVDVVSEVKGM